MKTFTLSIFTSLITLIFISTSAFSNTDSLFAGGSGTEMEPYLIENAEHLYNVRHFLDAYFLQTSDIDLDTLDYTLGTGWEPIGSCDQSLEGIPFSGHYDGGGHSISNLFIDRSDSIPAGLFGCTQTAVFKNLELLNVEITHPFWGGSLIGNNLSGSHTMIENVHVSGQAQFGERCGGMVGIGHSLIIENSTANVNVDGEDLIGGMVGILTDGEIYDSQTSGNLTGDTGVGGVVGRVNSSFLKNVSSSASLNLIGGESGGVVGEVNSSTVDSCSFTGDFFSSDVECGGVIGIASRGVIINCYSEGTLECFGTGGGIVGNMTQSELSGSHSIMTIKTPAGGGGGLVGVAGNSSITNSSFDGEVGEEGVATILGGIIGLAAFQVDIYNVTSSGIILGNENTGGVAGRLVSGSSLVNASSDATVKSGFKVGGIVGDIRDSSIDSVEFNGTVEGVEAVGGILGMSSGFSTNELSHAINNGSVMGDIEVGGIVGRLEIDLNITNVINNSAVSGISEVGGIVGSIRMAGGLFDTTFISNVLNTGNISGETRVGGIMGEHIHIGVYNNMHSTGNISGTDYVGGYFGYFESTEGMIELTDLHFSDSVSGEFNVGGIFGKAHIVQLSRISSTGSVIGDFSVGGIAGELDSTIVELSYFNGTIEGMDFIGGLAGQLNRSEVHNTYVRGSMISPEGMAGGIAGLGQNSIVTNSYAAVDLMEDQILNGIFSELDESEALRSYYIPGAVTTPGNGDENGILSSEEDMTYPYSSEIYEDWDFTEIWSFDYDYSVNDGFPYLSWGADTARGDFFLQIIVVEDGLGTALGEGYYDEGAAVTVEAIVDDPDNYEFVSWEDDQETVLSEDPVYEFTMSGNNLTLFAVFDMISSIKDIEDFQVQMYPNPASDRVVITHAEKIEKLNLIRSNGQLIRSVYPGSDTFELNVSDLSQGWYLIAIKGANGWMYQRLSIAR